MSTHPLRRGCSLAQTFPLFHVRGRSARSPTAQASRSTPFVECKFDEWKHYRRTVFRSQEPAFLSKTPGISYKETNGIRQHAPYLFHAGNAIPPCRRNPERTMEKQPENVLKKCTSAARNRYDTRESTTCKDGHTPRTDGNRRPDNDAHSARIPPITKRNRCYSAVSHSKKVVSAGIEPTS